MCTQRACTAPHHLYFTARDHRTSHVRLLLLTLLRRTYNWGEFSSRVSWIFARCCYCCSCVISSQQIASWQRKSRPKWETTHSQVHQSMEGVTTSFTPAARGIKFRFSSPISHQTLGVSKKRKISGSFLWSSSRYRFPFVTHSQTIRVSNIKQVGSWEPYPRHIRRSMVCCRSAHLRRPNSKLLPEITLESWQSNGTHPESNWNETNVCTGLPIAFNKKYHMTLSLWDALLPCTYSCQPKGNIRGLKDLTGGSSSCHSPSPPPLSLYLLNIYKKR